MKRILVSLRLALGFNLQPWPSWPGLIWMGGLEAGTLGTWVKLLSYLGATWVWRGKGAYLLLCCSHLGFWSQMFVSCDTWVSWSLCWAQLSTPEYEIPVSSGVVELNPGFWLAVGKGSQRQLLHITGIVLLQSVKWVWYLAHTWAQGTVTLLWYSWEHPVLGTLSCVKPSQGMWSESSNCSGSQLGAFCFSSPALPRPWGHLAVSGERHFCFGL